MPNDSSRVSAALLLAGGDLGVTSRIPLRLTPAAAPRPAGSGEVKVLLGALDGGRMAFLETDSIQWIDDAMDALRDARTSLVEARLARAAL